MPLAEYRRKRDFDRTPEPAGGEPGGPPAAETVQPASGDAPAGRFVVGRHRATRLHYDLRLEVDGVLVSWSVPKGPTLDPGVRRMAVRVEDHPIEYLDFEGVIPAGSYGAGDAIVWDRGTYEPEKTDDPSSALAAGELKFRLEGEKLRGRFTIVQTGGDQWLLIKKRDADAVPGWDAEAHPRSILTGRTNEEVAAADGAGAATPGSSARSGPSVRRSHAQPATPDEIPGAVLAPMPGFVEPMAATLGEAPFSDPDWLFEVKWDGYRVQTRVRAGAVRSWTRTGRDAAGYVADLVVPPVWIDADEAIVDGELVALRPDGAPDFGLLQERLGHAGRWTGRSDREAAPEPRGVLAYEVFDMLYLDGRSLLDVALEVRKALLRRVLREHPAVRYAGHVEGDGEPFFRAAVQRGLEGVMAKHRRSRYLPGGRTSAWLKLKSRPEQEFVVIGYALGTGSHADLGSLILGVDQGGGLRYAGRVGSGIDARTRAGLRADLDRRVRPVPAVAGVPPAELRDPDVRWVDPGPVVRVRFAGWTRDGVVRQSSFSGFDVGRPSGAVVRERAVRSGPGRPPVVPVADLVAERGATGLPGAPDRSGTADGPDVSGGLAPDSASLRTDGRPVGARARATVATGDEIGPSLGALDAAMQTLDAMGNAGAWRIGDQTVHLTNLDKLLFPGDGLTKRDLIRYLVEIAGVLLPHLHERPLNLTRFPGGIDGPSFWQRELPSSAPRWLRRWREPEPADRRAHTYLIADGPAALAWLGNMAAIELHPWTSTTASPATPSFALIDIDPGERTTFEDVVILARLYRTALDHLGVRGYPKLTGKRGIQVFVPVLPIYTFDQTRDWVEQLSRAVAAAVPDLVSWEWAVGQRAGLARLDYTQNARNKTLVAPYSVRPLPGAPVSAPIAWDELDEPGLAPGRWTIATMPGRIHERGDLFAGALTDRQRLPGL